MSKAKSGFAVSEDTCEALYQKVMGIFDQEDGDAFDLVAIERYVGLVSSILQDYSKSFQVEFAKYVCRVHGLKDCCRVLACLDTETQSLITAEKQQVPLLPLGS